MLHRFVTVVTTDEPERFERILYGHSEIVATYVETRKAQTPRYHLLVRTSAASDVDYLANYQRGRIQSLLAGVSAVFETADAALATHRETWGFAPVVKESV